MSENLYQFRLPNPDHPVGTIVKVNGGYDTWGYIVSAKGTNAEGTLYIIRGTGKERKGLSKSSYIIEL